MHAQRGLGRTATSPRCVGSAAPTPRRAPSPAGNRPDRPASSRRQRSRSPSQRIRPARRTPRSARPAIRRGRAVRCGCPGTQLISQTSSSSSPCNRVNQRSSVGGPPAGNEVVVAAGEHVVGGDVGGVQQIGQPQPGRTGTTKRGAAGRGGSGRAGRDWDRSRQRGEQKPCGKLQSERAMQAAAVKADNTPERSAASRRRVLHRLAGCGGTRFRPLPCSTAPSRPLVGDDRRRRTMPKTPRRGRAATTTARQPPPRRRRVPRGRHHRGRRAGAVDRRGVLPGLSRGEGVDVGPSGRPQATGREVPGRDAEDRVSSGRAPGTSPGRHCRLPRQAGVIVAAEAATNDECG